MTFKNKNFFSFLRLFIKMPIMFCVFFCFSSFLISHSDFRPTTLGKKQEKIRLRIYKIYAWGFPLLITMIAAIMDNIPDAQHLLRPRFGEITCWFVGECFATAHELKVHVRWRYNSMRYGSVWLWCVCSFVTFNIWFLGDMEMFVYFFGPIGLLLCVNICFFASTTRSLMCGLWKQDDVKSSTERYSQNYC